MKSTNTKSRKTLGGLSAYITELDSLRPPSRFGLSSQSFIVTMELLFKQQQKSYFTKKNNELNQKVSRHIHDFRTDTKVDSKEMILPFVFLFVVMFLAITIADGITVIYSLSIIQSLLSAVIVSLPLLYIYFSFIIMNRRRVLGERHNEEIKRSVQSLIEFGVQFTENNHLNQDPYPIKLRHNDYKGLSYEKRGNNNYVGFFEK
ncbi:hypothetical protein [Methanobacterium formicicum]|uniref:Uncharacterized protein n=1 Tax=Methanobacterium formicicum (strain DSM 3637 / PP1) TaxID=1204725 RepID=K2QYX2_METFP|nr:hypothetical protein [Methanobacterium formicicum]EKF85508.1 hypothetical protein A994_08741 [Methanobacterium formicicum DSM 3637]